MGRNRQDWRRGEYRPGNEFDDMRGRHVSRFKELRSRLYRSNNGIALGVFRGIAESMGWSVCLTRWVGVVALLMLSGSTGAHGAHASLFVAGFFYLLAALLMQPPRSAGAQFFGGLPTTAAGPSGPPPIPSRPAAVPYQEVPRARVDLAALDRQLDSLNRRIQSMETIVTDRQYDWDRRMEGK